MPIQQTDPYFLISNPNILVTISYHVQNSLIHSQRISTQRGLLNKRLVEQCAN